MNAPEGAIPAQRDPDSEANARAAWVRRHLESAPPLTAAQRDLIQRALTQREPTNTQAHTGINTGGHRT